MKKTDDELCLPFESLISGCHPVSALANAASFIFCSVEDVSWAGFYIVSGDRLVLGPFCGEPACIEIPLGSGVCGRSASEGKTFAVPDVRAFPGHIACDPLSRSEIVVPIRYNNAVVAVLDVDSHTVGRFGGDDDGPIGRLALSAERIIGPYIGSVL